MQIQNSFFFYLLNFKLDALMDAPTFMFFFFCKYSRQLTDKSEIIQSVSLQNIGFIVAEIPANVQ